MAVVRGTKRPHVLVFDDYRKISRHVALKIATRINSNREAQDRRRTVLGLATGSSPLGVYRELVRMYREGSVDFSECAFFNLDEYYGLSETAIQSYHRFMRENFFDYINARDDQIHIPSGTIHGEENIRESCLEYEGNIRGLGGIDIQLLGLGRNGHIGFNEPGSSIDSRTRLVDLAESTRRDAAPDFFGFRNVPTKAVTMGIATILEAREIVLLASGEHKSRILQSALEGPPDPQVPASFIQMHENVEVLSDPAAASRLIEYSAPWILKENIDWIAQRELSYSAIIWLAQRRRKQLFDLAESDYRSEHLGSLYNARGAKFASDAIGEFKSKVGALIKIIDKKTENRSPAKKARVLLFSPHPDDDVICMGATMRKLVSSGYDVQVAYMVSGSNAVKDLDVLSYIDLQNKPVNGMISDYGDLNGEDFESTKANIIKSIYSRAKGSPDKDIVRMIKAEIRRQEASRAASLAGVKTTHFLNLPFYEEFGSARKAPLSSEDVEIVRNLLLSVMPDCVFLAGDTTDPNGTHSVCLDAFQDAFSSLRDFATTEEEKSYARGRESIAMFHYRGAWQEYSLEEADAIETFDESDLGQKIVMILEHVSQIDPLFPGPDDDRQFWERVRDRNRNFAKICASLGVDLGQPAAEVYKVVQDS